MSSEAGSLPDTTGKRRASGADADMFIVCVTYSTCIADSRRREELSYTE